MKPDSAKQLLAPCRNDHVVGRAGAGTIRYLAGLIELCAPDAKKPWDR